MKFCTGKQKEDWRVESMDKIYKHMGKKDCKYVIELHRSEEDGGDLFPTTLFGSKIDLDFLFRNHPELKSITFKPANEEGQTNDKD